MTPNAAPLSTLPPSVPTSSCWIAHGSTSRHDDPDCNAMTALLVLLLLTGAAFVPPSLAASTAARFWWGGLATSLPRGSPSHTFTSHTRLPAQVQQHDTVVGV